MKKEAPVEPKGVEVRKERFEAEYNDYKIFEID